MSVAAQRAPDAARGVAPWLTAGGTAASRQGPDFTAAGELHALLSAVVRGARVDYPALVARHDLLDRVVHAVGAVSADVESQWTPAARMAFWINAYNVFTLQAVADRYDWSLNDVRR